MPPKLLLAPLQGLTDHTFRNVFPAYFQGIDCAYTPYFSINAHNLPSRNKIKKILAAGSDHFPVIPQVLTNDPMALVLFADLVKEMGIEIINLNMGCPFKVVTKKQKGAGMLPDPEYIDRFFASVFEKLEINLSLKVRLGQYSSQEIFELLPIFNQHPVKEIIVHPRTGEEYYEGKPNQELFHQVVQQSEAPVIYNGDIFSLSDFSKLTTKFPFVDTIMLGRGYLQNPFLGEILKGNTHFDLKKVKAFMTELAYKLSEDRSKMKRFPQGIKEFWSHLCLSFENPEKVFDRIKRVNTFEEYNATTERVFEEFMWIS